MIVPLGLSIIVSGGTLLYRNYITFLFYNFLPIPIPLYFLFVLSLTMYFFYLLGKAKNLLNLYIVHSALFVTLSHSQRVKRFTITKDESISISARYREHEAYQTLTRLITRLITSRDKIWWTLSIVRGGW